MKILVIDDDPGMTDLLRMLLEPSGLRVFTANYGPDGVALARSESPDIVILDIMMPDVDGLQVCTELRKFSTIPILVLSAMDSPSIIARSLNSGADDFLVKPVPSSILIAHLNKLLRRTLILPRLSAALL
jgi:DNA-binding response OmpR family regulator